VAKKHILLSYKIFDAISNGNLSESESWHFIKALVEYDRSGIFPDFPRGEANALWIVIKPELDSYARHWKEEVKRRSSAGKKGGSSTSEKKAAAARENGRRGGASLGNKNAAKTTQADNENVNVNVNDIDFENANNNGNEKTDFDDVL
jgi:hypothetical protein